MVPSNATVTCTNQNNTSFRLGHLQPNNMNIEFSGHIPPPTCCLLIYLTHTFIQIPPALLVPPPFSAMHPTPAHLRLRPPQGIPSPPLFPSTHYSSFWFYISLLALPPYQMPPSVVFCLLQFTTSSLSLSPPFSLRFDLLTMNYSFPDQPVP